MKSGQYFTIDEAEVLLTARSYTELASVALAQLSRMRLTNSRLPGIVCGPISNGGLGSKALNIERFRRAVEHFTLRSNGCFFSQMPFEEALWRVQDVRAEYEPGVIHPKGAGNPLLEEFYRPIFEARFVGHAIFLSGWETSDGARFERELCLALDIVVYDMGENYELTEYLVEPALSD